jgi:hypothetical protein
MHAQKYKTLQEWVTDAAGHVHSAIELRERKMVFNAFTEQDRRIFNNCMDLGNQCLEVIGVPPAIRKKFVAMTARICTAKERFREFLAQHGLSINDPTASALLQQAVQTEDLSDAEIELVEYVTRAGYGVDRGLLVRHVENMRKKVHEKASLLDLIFASAAKYKEN